MIVPWAHHLGRESVTGPKSFLSEALQESSANTKQCAGENHESFVVGMVIAQERRSIQGIAKTTERQGWFRASWVRSVNANAHATIKKKVGLPMLRNVPAMKPKNAKVVYSAVFALDWTLVSSCSGSAKIRPWGMLANNLLGHLLQFFIIGRTCQ